MKVGDKVYNDTISSKRVVFGVVTEILPATDTLKQMRVDSWKANGVKINTTHCISNWNKY